MLGMRRSGFWVVTRSLFYSEPCDGDARALPIFALEFRFDGIGAALPGRSRRDSHFASAMTVAFFTPICRRMKKRRLP
jgi:hypothetical protein